MMIKSVRWQFWCCEALALSLSCARIQGGSGSSPDGEPTGSGSSAGGRSGGGPSGTGGGVRGSVGWDAGPTCDDVNAQFCVKDAPVCGFFPGQVERLPPDVLIVADRSR